MSVLRLPFALLLLVSLSGCDDSLARPSDREVDARVTEAADRLGASDAGQRVLSAIEAHGGLEAWYGSGPLRFRYAYTRLDSLGEPTEQPALDTRQMIDVWASRAVHTLATDTTISFGWTGSQAWALPSEEAIPTDARFWSLTPYYFVGMPFVLADPGVNLEMAEPLALSDSTTLDQVYVTFDPGTGDAPDDYYYLLLDPETDEVRGVRYVVSYGPFNPDGGHTPETIMLYDGAQTVGDIVIQEGFRSFAWNGTGPGTPKARGAVSETSFATDATDAAFAPPPEAVVLPDLEL
ncbi:MAG: hypothetical protein AAFQ43_03730 [Bacteroidota bacterium]